MHRSSVLAYFWLISIGNVGSKNVTEYLYSSCSVYVTMVKNNERTVRMVLLMDESISDWIRHEAKKKNKSLSGFVRDAVVRYFRYEDKIKMLEKEEDDKEIEK